MAEHRHTAAYHLLARAPQREYRSDMQRLPPVMSPMGSIPHAGPQQRPRNFVRPGPQPLSGQNMVPRHASGIAPIAASFVRAATRGSAFRPTVGGGGGSSSLGSMFSNDVGQQRAPGSYRCIGKLDPATNQRRPCVMTNQSGMGAPLVMGIDDYFIRGGDGPLCENCWADSWVTHPMQNRPGMPPCRFGVHWDDAEWAKMQQTIHATIQNFLSPVGEDGRPRIDQYGRPYQPRYPSPDEINEVLKSFKFSRDCPRCAKLLRGAKVPIAFVPDVSDFQISGINAP